MENQVLEEKILKYYLELKSAPEISKLIKTPLHKVYKILKQHKVERRKAVVQNKIRFEKSPLSYNYKKSLTPKEKELSSAALMLYVGEGAKTGNTVDFANSNVATHKVFLNYLRKVCQINENKLKLYLYCFSDQDINELLAFWSKSLNVKLSHFTQPYIRESTGNSFRKMTHGVLHIRYSDKRLLNKLLELSERLTINLSK